MVQRTICPRCSHTRTKGRTQKCLTIFDNGNEFCNHCGYNSAKEKKDEHGIRYKAYKKPAQVIPNKELPDNILGWFKERMINEGVLRRNKVGWNGKEMLFPYFYSGEIINIKYRTLDKKFRQEKDAEKAFYGLDDISSDDEDVYIVEGEIDKFSCEVAGFTNVLSVPDGAPAPDAKTYYTKFEFIDRWEHLLNYAKRIIIAVDSDAPGKKLEAELMRRLDPARCWIVRWPDGCKDANDVLIKHDILGLLTCLENPKQAPLEGVFTVEDYNESINELYENGLQGGLATGWIPLDQYYTIREGEVTIVTGIPSHGKSSWLTALIMNIARSHSWRFGIFSPENQPLQRYISVMAANYIGKPFKVGIHTRMSRDELEAAKKWINDHMLFIMPNDDCLGIVDIIDKAKSTVMRYGINGLIIDPWNEIDHRRPPGMTETEYISSSLTKIRQFARAFHSHVWIVAHPAKMMKDSKGAYPVPTAYDISGSAHWYNKADNVITVWRDVLNEARNTQVHVQKIRFREIGKPGKAHLKHNIMTGTYEAAEDDTNLQKRSNRSMENNADVTHEDVIQEIEKTLF